MASPGRLRRPMPSTLCDAYHPFVFGCAQGADCTKLCTFCTEILPASFERTVTVTLLFGINGPFRPNATTAILGLSVVIIFGDDAPSTDAEVAAQGRSQKIENMAGVNIPSTVKLTVTPGFTPRGPSIKPSAPILGRGTSGVMVISNIFGGPCNA
jgi:hypothetical protein